MKKYILSIDQSTQGTKALLLDDTGAIVTRADLPHRQIITDNGWVEHDLEEIYANTIQAAKDTVEKAGIDPGCICAIGISNQRETSACWFRESGKPVYNAIVWQCARGAQICELLAAAGNSEMIRAKTGLPLSPYFSAAKLAWIFQNVPGIQEEAEKGNICVGTIDSFLVFRMTGGKEHRTDYSNASRTQLFNIHTLGWDEELLRLFGIPACCMPELTDSDGKFGMTDLEGYLPVPVPICGVMGDSHAALFGHGCLRPGMAKVTYGTGSSIMMNIGNKPVMNDDGLVSGIAWRVSGETSYIFEGNINYTGAVVSWLKDDLKLISSPGETEELAKQANANDTSYLVPAFSGLGAPYWDSSAKAAIVGMTRTTGKNEICRAALESIAYQITDIVLAMKKNAPAPLEQLRADGGPTRNGFLMQFQSNILDLPLSVPGSEELSGIGAAYAAGLSCGLYDKSVIDVLKYTRYTPVMDADTRNSKLHGWHKAIGMVSGHHIMNYNGR